MPTYRYKCNLCDNETTRFIVKKEDYRGYYPCYCGGVMERQLSAPTVTVIETIDNGAVVKKVEQRKDIKEILKERSDQDRRTRKGK